jgi:hypothetical protein
VSLSLRDRRVRVYSYSDADQGKSGVIKPLYIFEQECWAAIRAAGGSERSAGAEAQRQAISVFIFADTVAIPRNGLLMIKANGEMYRVQTVDQRRWEHEQHVRGLLTDEEIYNRNDQTVFIPITAIVMSGAGTVLGTATLSFGIGQGGLAGAGSAFAQFVQQLISTALAAGGGSVNAVAGLLGTAAISLAGAGSLFGFSAETIPGTVATEGGGSIAAAGGIQGVAAIGLAGMGSLAAVCQQTLLSTASVAGGGSIAAAGPGTPPNNEPPGMTAVVNTGPMSVTPATFGQNGGASGGSWSTGGPIPITLNNFSNGGAAPNSSGDWSGNIIKTPAPDTGFRVLYGPSLPGGNSPVHFGGSWAGSRGTGFVYFRFRFRYSPAWTLSTASGMKLARIQPVAETGENSFISGFGAHGQPTDGSNLWPGALLQGVGSGGTYFANIPGTPGANDINNPAAFWNAIANIGGAARGSWHWVEIYQQPESPLGVTPGNGQLTYWVDGVLAYTTVGSALGTGGVPNNGILFNRPGDTPGNYFIEFDPTFGGDSSSDHPPSQYFDVDDLYISVK